MHQQRVVLKQPVYVLREPNVPAYIALRGDKPRLERHLHLATIVPATPECRAELTELAVQKLKGVTYELERVDSL